MVLLEVVLLEVLLLEVLLLEELLILLLEVLVELVVVVVPESTSTWKALSNATWLDVSGKHLVSILHMSTPRYCPQDIWHHMCKT